jgi:hypothetical protein
VSNEAAPLKLENDLEKEIWTKAQIDFSLTLLNQQPLYQNPCLTDLVVSANPDEVMLAGQTLHAIAGVASSLADRLILYRRHRANIITRPSGISLT